MIKSMKKFVLCVIFLSFVITKCSLAQRINAVPFQLLSLSAENQKGITYNENAASELFLNTKVKDREVVVVSIVGVLKKGKSFLLNYMLRYLYAHYPTLSSSELINADNWMGDANEPLTGFGWKSGGNDASTNGLLMWGDVFLYDAPNGDKFAIYIMDTQVLFDHRLMTTENSEIISLGTLISSLQILNIFHRIRENQMQFLQNATNYASSDDNICLFQNLLILIRDWNDVSEYQYGLNGGDAYLKNFLEIHDHQTEEFQNVRRYMRSSFDKINCFLMPYPSKKVATDKNYNGRWADIDEDFIEEMKELFNFIFKNLKPKTINGVAIKANELFTFIKSYVENFNSGNATKLDQLKIAIENTIGHRKKASSIQLLSISTDDQKGMKYNENAASKLFLNSKLKDRKVVVISIVGLFKKGKTFLLNYMLRYLYAHYPTLSSSELVNADNWMGDPNEPLTGFSWKSDADRIKPGLIMWGDVFLHDALNGEKFVIYIMDTEKIFDHRMTTADNIKIFSLSTLISSVQILNIFNEIQENQLQFLQLATEYVSSNADSTPFQNLLMLIRDWNDVDEYEYGLSGGDAYVKSFLQIHDQQSQELQNVRRYLKSSFEKINCFLMPYPSKKVATDKTYDGRWADIDEDFIEAMNGLFAHIFEKLNPKTINEGAITSEELFVFIQNYVETFNSRNITNATFIIQSTSNIRKAQNMDDEAKVKLEEANANVNEAKTLLQYAKTDTVQAQLEAEELKKKLNEAEQQRIEAIEKEKQTREWLKNISQDRDYFKQEYNKLINQEATNEQTKSGFDKFIDKTISTANSVVDKISKWFG